MSSHLRPRAFGRAQRALGSRLLRGGQLDEVGAMNQTRAARPGVSYRRVSPCARCGEGRVRPWPAAAALAAATTNSRARSAGPAVPVIVPAACRDGGDELHKRGLVEQRMTKRSRWRRWRRQDGRWCHRGVCGQWTTTRSPGVQMFIVSSSRAAFSRASSAAGLLHRRQCSFTAEDRSARRDVLCRWRGQRGAAR
ncbi:MAG: hypothetical protein U5O16_40490 [Rhodococcus sp. (in: high G+C Gram-positive bacteria)]|uniref:hypothetical protein n=1 Tax=Rhodococcus sp. TaxID=1831 RepID=UPI002AD5D93C|nr:hypothetical protein [Rhodococcus sp. (in: high G+C Gram-positive bacteria)]